MTMHSNTNRVELELHRDSLWLRLSFFGELLRPSGTSRDEDSA